MNKIFLAPIFILILNQSGFTQQSEAATLNQNQQIDIVKVYEKVVEDGYESFQIFEKLANSN